MVVDHGLVQPLAAWPHASLPCALRAVALGRKNFLFAGSDASGQRATATYSLIGSAELNGLDPQTYLHHVLECIDHPINRIEDLLPWAIADELKVASNDRLAA